MLLRIYNEDVELVNHTTKSESSAAATPAAEQSDAPKESEAATSEDAALAGVAAEQDSVAAEDTLRKEVVEARDDELNKVAEAMPERAGEEDVSNKTI